MERVKKLQSRRAQSGFTLVELSIVLVIIGLIVSSVLVGQDLVRSAALRATITQLQQFQAGVGTFQGKYNALPGDVKGNTLFGFTGDGDASGYLTTVAAAGATTFAANENMFFWSHLGASGAGLIPGAYDGAALTKATIAGSLPAAKAGNYWGVFAGRLATAEGGAETGQNFYMLGVTGGTAAGQGNAVNDIPTLTANEAYGIDSKIDDGKPSAGAVRARGLTVLDSIDQAPSSALAATGGQVCTTYVATSYITAPSTNVYQTKSSGAQCNLRFKL